MSEVKIIIAGGGTGGHIQPSIAVIKAIRVMDPGVKFLWLGEKGGSEESAAYDLDIEFFPIRCGKLHRRFTYKNINMPFKTVVGYGQALLALRRFKPDVVFSKAGYVAVPTVFAAATLHIPVVIHESDIVMGLANRMVRRFAKAICVGFPKENYVKKYQKKIFYTGNPLVKAVPIKRVEAAKYFNLNPEIPVLLVFGGSQGALSISRLVIEALPDLLEFTQVIHQTGVAHQEMADKAKAILPRELACGYVVKGFFDRSEMSNVLSLGDLALSRTGANAIADFSRFGIPMVMMPLPSAAKNHQALNAEFVASKGGGVLMTQASLSTEKLVSCIENLILDKKALNEMSERIRGVNLQDAAENIAKIILTQKR